MIRTCDIPLGWCACLYCRWAVRLGQDQFSGVLESGAMRKSELHAIPRITLSQQRLTKGTQTFLGEIESIDVALRDARRARIASGEIVYHAVGVVYGEELTGTENRC